MACAINGRTVRNGISSLLDKEFTSSNIFDKDGNSYTVRAGQTFAAREFVGGLNTKFSEPVIRRDSDVRYTIAIPDSLVLQYVDSSVPGRELTTISDMFFEHAYEPTSWNYDTAFSALNYPEISQFTYDTLVSFLKSVNPNFRVEEVENLSTDGLTQLKKFLISVRTLSKFQALPEEVAHVVIEMMPDEEPIKQELINNVTSFQIYSDTLAQYKNVYTLPNGNPDYDKIKREAAAKLLGEYVTAQATGNHARVQELTKPKQGWLERWWYKLLNFLGIRMLDVTKPYADLAASILSGKADMSLKTEKDVEDMTYANSYFFRMSEKEAYANAEQIMKARPKGLFETIEKFSREFGRRFHDVLKDERYSQLEEMLRKTGDTVGKINNLSEIHILLTESKLDMKATLDSASYLSGLKQFIEAIDRLDILSNAILDVIRSKEKSKDFDEAIKNITELEAYFGIYETFNNIISAELAQVLIDSNVAPDVIESIQRSQLGFANVNKHILTKLRNELFIFYKTILQSTNDVVSQTLAEDMERFKNDPKALEFVKARMNKLMIPDEDIIKMLSGTGRDIDNLSSVNHLVNAAYTNGDVYIAGIAKYVQDRISRAQNKGSIVIRSLYDKLDPIQKQLNEDAVKTGSIITFLDSVYDRDTEETRQVLSWLNPHKNVQPAMDAHRRAMNEAGKKLGDVDKNTPEFDEALENFKKVQGEYHNFLEKYFNRPFVREYYEFRKKYDANADFIVAMNKWAAFGETIKQVEDYLGNEPENDDLWEQLAKVKRDRANLLYERDANGDMKSADELREVKVLKDFFEEQSKFRELDDVQTRISFMTARNRYEQKINFTLTEIKKLNPKTIQDVEGHLRSYLKDPRLRIDTAYTEGTEPGDPLDWDFIHKLVMERWYKKNITIQRNEEFYKYEAAIFEELNKLQAKGELTDTDKTIKAAYEAIRGILFGSRNEIGHINPDALTETEKADVIQLEALITQLRRENSTGSVFLEDFTPEDKFKYEQLGKILEDDSLSLTDQEKKQILYQKTKIASKYKNTGRSKTVKDLLSLLGELTRKTPTIYYWDRLSTLIPLMAEFGMHVNNLTEHDDQRKIVNSFVKDFTDSVDYEDHDRLDFYVYEQELFGAFLKWLKINHPNQYNWFVDSHLEKSVWDHDNGSYIKLKYARSAVYNYIEPTQEAHKKIVFNRKFQKYRIKDEYRTGYNPETKKVELKVGTHITNREVNGFPEFMPLLPEQGEPIDSPYHNHAYYELRDKDPLRFQYLQLLRDIDLQEQQRVPSRLRRWNQVPVISLTHIEKLDPTHVKDVAKENWAHVQSIFKKDTKLAGTDGDAEAEARGEDTVKEIDQFTQTTIQQRIPKLGMSQKIPVDRVSRDMLRSTAQFVLRAHEFEARTEAEPVVKAIIRLMEQNKKEGHISNKERAKKFESIYSQMILQELPETTLNTKFVRRVSKFLTTNTSFRMIADPFGGIINYTSAMINNVIEASAGKYLNLADLSQGKYLAYRVNYNLMADFNKKTNLSVDTLLFQTFDFIQGDFEEDLLDRSSSKNKHAGIRQMLMIPRKSGELVAQTSVAMGILHRQKVKNSIDGKTYPMHEIYTREGNNLKLKAGFPDEYNPVDGKMFEKVKDLIHRVNLELHGNYAKISQSEASRYAVGKLAENMKRWFMPAFQRRFGRETVDLTYESPNEGYYRTTARALRNVFGAMLHLDFGGAKSWMNVFLKTPRYQQNLRRVGAEFLCAFLAWMLFAVALGYSGPDKDKELKTNSWWTNSAILILVRVYSETTAYIPVPPFGFQEMKRNVLTPFSLPADAVSNIAAVAQLGLYQIAYSVLGMDSLRKDLYYSKDSGYWYSEKGDSKLLKYVLNALGYSGYHTNPDQYIRQFQSIQGRLK